MASRKQAFSGQQSGSSTVPQTPLPLRPVVSNSASYGSHSSQENTDTQGDPPSSKRQRISYPPATTGAGYASKVSAAPQYPSYSYGPEMRVQGYTPLPQSYQTSPHHPYQIPGYPNYPPAGQSGLPSQPGPQRGQQSGELSTFQSPFTSPTTQLSPLQYSNLPPAYNYSTQPYGAYPAPPSTYPAAHNSAQQSPHPYGYPPVAQQPYLRYPSGPGFQPAQYQLASTVTQRPFSMPPSAPRRGSQPDWSSVPTPLQGAYGQRRLGNPVITPPVLTPHLAPIIQHEHGAQRQSSSDQVVSSVDSDHSSQDQQQDDSQQNYPDTGAAAPYHQG